MGHSGLVPQFFKKVRTVYIAIINDDQVLCSPLTKFF